jgi:hypothetical protein
MPFRPITDISPVVPGGTVTITPPVGMTYHQIQVLLANLTPAQCTQVQVYVGTKVVQEFDDLTRLAALNAYYNRPQTGLYHSFWFDRPELESQDREITALGTQDVSSFQIKFKVDAAAVNPSISVRADRSAGTPLGLITKIKSNTFAFTSAGEVDMTNMPKIGNVAAFHFHKPTDDISEIRLVRDEVDQIESPVADLEEWQKQYGRVPQANFVHADFLLKGDISRALEVQNYADGKKVQELFAKLTLGTAETVTLISEHLDSLTGA